jgi:Fis family transcriptional regulator
MNSSSTPRAVTRGEAAKPVRGGETAKPARGGEPAKPASRQCESIEECMLRSLGEYFENLGGARPHALHEMVMTAVERPLLKFALERAQGNQSAAAELLGMNRNTLRKKLLEHKLAK